MRGADRKGGPIGLNLPLIHKANDEINADNEEQNNT